MFCALFFVSLHPMAKITLIKNYRKKETLRLCDLSDVVEFIRSEEYQELVLEIQRLCSVLDLSWTDDDSFTGLSDATDKLPRICFATEQENRNRQRLMRGYTGMVLLEINNLLSYDEADAIRTGAGEVPQTLLAFVGASGRSVKIVCRGELFPGDRQENQPLPVDEQLIQDFHENLYERARLAYNAQLGVTVEKLEPKLGRCCYVSYDAKAIYNPMAMPIYARAEKPSRNIALFRPSNMEPETDSAGRDRYLTLREIFEFNLEKAYDECEGLPDGEEREHLLLTRLAVHCMETGVPMAVARRLVRYHSSPLGCHDLLADKVFSNVYRSRQMRRYTDVNNINPERHVPAETLLTMKIDVFLNENYEIRKNVLRGVAEFRERTGVGFSFRDMTEEARNSITMRALLQGIKCWDKDIRRYINSENIELYDPLNEYLDNLPKWDGRDRVGELAARVPTDYQEWPELFHVWMRSMVAMWMGKGQLTGNALVPLLIGRQGCGKSSFCRILLPRDLRDYYNDRINFKNENDLNLGLTSFALINLDEFDKITSRQQIVLKYLVSTADLKYRPPYGKAYTEHRRYASFIGTTNDLMPLSDPSGARRFVCVMVNGNIDFHTPINYPQLYAQLLQELKEGANYWPSKVQELQLMEHNRHFQQISGLNEMLMHVIERPNEEDQYGRWMNLKEISDLLSTHFPHYKEDAGTLARIGRELNRPDNLYKHVRRKTGMVYWVKVRE